MCLFMMFCMLSGTSIEYFPICGVMHENWGKPSGGTDFPVDARSRRIRQGATNARRGVQTTFGDALTTHQNQIQKIYGVNSGALLECSGSDFCFGGKAT